MQDIKRPSQCGHTDRGKPENVRKTGVDIIPHRARWMQWEDVTMYNTQNDLLEIVTRIRDEINKLYEASPSDGEIEAAEESGEAYDIYSYFSDVLDVEYTIDSQFRYKSVRVAVTLGGPNIYIDTRAGAVLGYWGTDRAEAWIPSEVCAAIDSIFEDIFICSR